MFGNTPADYRTRGTHEHEAGVKIAIILNRPRLLTIGCIPLVISTVSNV
jgi:hypothetical protein